MKANIEKTKEVCKNLILRLEEQHIKVNLSHRKNSEIIYVTINSGSRYTCRDYGQLAMFLHGIQAGLKLNG